MAEILGFDPLKIPPTKERFSHFLRTIPNNQLQEVQIFLTQKLIENKVISGKSIALDSCPIKANVKKNNLKTSVKDRFNKNRIPSGDPDAKLGISVKFPKPFKPKISYFWGYRNHTITDIESELPIGEKPSLQTKMKRNKPFLFLKN